MADESEVDVDELAESIRMEASERSAAVDVDDWSSRPTSHARRRGVNPSRANLNPDNKSAALLGDKGAARLGDRGEANASSIPDILDLDELNEEQLRAMGEKIAQSLARKNSSETNSATGIESGNAGHAKNANANGEIKEAKQEDPLLRKDNQWTDRAVGVALRRSLHGEEKSAVPNTDIVPKADQEVSEKDNYESLGAISVAMRESLKRPGAHAVSLGDDTGGDGDTNDCEASAGIAMEQVDENCALPDLDVDTEPSCDMEEQAGNQGFTSLSPTYTGTSSPTNAEPDENDLEQGESSVLYADSRRSSEGQPPEHQLIRADLVEQDVVEAQEIGDMVATNEELQKQVASKEKRFQIVVRLFSGFCIVLAVATGFAVLVLVVLWRKNQDDCPPSKEPFSSNLIQSVLDDINNDRCSPQGRANAWMWNDPNLDAYSEERQIQRFVMASAWYSTNAENTWNNTDHWLSYEVSECQWWTAHPDKESICDEQNVLRVVNLTSNGLSGSIPREALRLLVPKIVDLSHNQLTGEIPPMAKEMAAAVEYIDYSNNTLGGKFLVDFGVQGMGLRHFIVRDNQFTGELPVLPMPNLTSMDVSNNRFVGRLPSLLSFLADLQLVLMADNFLTGTIPKEVGYLKKLRIVDVSGNTEMQGTLPTELGLIQTFEWASVEGTQISGTIPEDLCQRVEAGLLEFYSDCGNNTLLQCCPSS